MTITLDTTLLYYYGTYITLARIIIIRPTEQGVGVRRHQPTSVAVNDFYFSSIFSKIGRNVQESQLNVTSFVLRVTLPHITCCVLPVAVARSSSVGDAIRYVLPVA